MKIESIKKFLKPNRGKITGFIILFIPVYIVFSLFFIECHREDIMLSCSHIFSPELGSIIFFSFLYFSSCLLIFIWDKIRNNSH